MKWKKLILPLLVTVLTIALCGCQKAKENSEPETVADPKTTPEYHYPDQIKERGVLKISSSAQSSVDYLLPDDPDQYGDLAGERRGYVPDFCRRIAEELEVELEIVEYDTVDEQLKALENGDVDIAAGAFTINDKRLELYEMTDRYDVVDEPGTKIFFSTNPQPWLPIEIVLGLETPDEQTTDEQEETEIEPEPREMLKNKEELALARIGLVKGSAQGEAIMLAYPEAEFYELGTNEDVLEALVDGTVDAGVFTSYDKQFQDQIKMKLAENKISISGYEIEDPDYKGYGLILMKGNEELCRYVNELTASLLDNGWLLETYKTDEKEAIKYGFLQPSDAHFKDENDGEE